KAPLAGVPKKGVLFTLAQGDPLVRNTTTGNVLRAGDLADRTLYFRGLDAYTQIGIQPDANDLHQFLFRFIDDVRKSFALAGQESVAAFLASDGDTTIDPDGAGPVFETPIVGPLPEAPCP